MRIAMVGPFAPPDGTITGGIEAVATYLAKGLARRAEIELHIVTLDTTGAPSESTQDGMTVHRLRSSGRWMRPTLFMSERRAITAKLRDLEPDVVHVQGQNFYAMGALAARMPTVVTLHGMLSREADILDNGSSLTERLSKRMRGWFNARFERAILRDATDLIIISDYVADTICGSTSARFHAICNPIDDSFFTLTSREVQGRLFFAGGIEPRKDLRLMIEAMALLPEDSTAHLHLVGRVVDEGYAASLRAFVAEHNLYDRVTFLGLIEQDALLHEYEEASVVVMASREESSPMLIQQAMAVGKAVVAPRVGGIPQLVDDGQTGIIVDLASPQALATGIDQAIRDSSARAAMAAAGRRKAEEHFAVDAVAAQTVGVYQSLLAPRTSEAQTTISAQEVARS